MIKVLIVDDETFTRTGLVKHINWSNLGIGVVREAKDGIEALTICNEFHPDILISDIRMPGMDGIELATHMREMLPDCIIIFLSGYADKEYLKSAITLGVLSYVEKPINIHEMTSSIKKAVTLVKDKMHKKDKHDQMNKALTDSLPFMKQKIVLSLISKKVDLQNLQSELRYMNYEIDIKSNFVTLILKLEPMEEYFHSEDPELSLEIMSFLEQELKSLQNITACKDQRHIVSIVSQNNTDEAFLLSELLPQINTKLLDKFGMRSRFFWAVGKKVYSLNGIYESYQTGVLTLQKLFYYGYGNIVYYQQKVPQEFQFDDNIEKSFFDLLKEYDRDKAISFIDNLCRNIQRNDATLVNHVKNLFYKLSLILAGEYEKRGISSIFKEENENYLWNLISNFHTIFEIRDYMLDKTRILIQHSKEMDFANRKIYDIQAFVQKNYSLSNLSLQMIADEVYLSPTYLCAFFKKETGKTLNEYITNFRIDKSKEFLLQRSSKLIEVSKKVGYNDANYYSKIFKKLIGITPSEYKEKTTL